MFATIFNLIKQIIAIFSRQEPAVKKPDVSVPSDEPVVAPAAPWHDYTVFDPGNVLPDGCIDGYLENFSVQDFFDEIGCFLKSYIDPQTGKLAAQVIDESCRVFNENQKIILFSLQREQSALSKKNVSEMGSYTKKDGTVINKIEWILGYGLLDEGQVLVKYKGFYNQIYNAARTYRKLFEEGKGQIGKPYKVYDGEPVTIFSATTYALYEYTPRIEASRLTWSIWRRYSPQDKFFDKEGV